MKPQQTFFSAAEQTFAAVACDAARARVCAFITGLVAALLIAAMTSAHSAVPGSNAAAQYYASGRILVDPRPGSTDAAFQKALADHGAASSGRLRGMTVHLVHVAPGTEQKTVAALAGHPNVRFAEVDQLLQPAAVANDPYFGSEWHLPRINAPTAWDSSIGSGAVIAILDTGVDGSHPDLAAQMVPGWNFYNNSSNTTDSNGHGTSVAGAAAAASNNAVGVTSVAGGARIMPVVIADPTAFAYWSTVAQGITWAADHGARAANLSYTGASASSTIISAAQYLRSKGGVLIVAAGNSGTVDNTAPTPYITVVSATDQNDQIASFSSYGSFVDIAAPGINILTTAMGGSYWNCWGTSLASPIVAGVAALVVAVRPDFSASQIDSALLSTATDLGGTGSDIYFGAGRVNAGAAVQQALAAPATADLTPPTVAIASPTGGSVSGIVTVAAVASDNVGVARVDLRVNGQTVASDSTAPYQFAWDSTTIANGTVTVTAVAYDAAGNSGISAPVALNVSNASPVDTTPPTVAIASPAGGTVSATIGVSVSASDNVGVTRVDLRLNGQTIGSRNVAPYQFSWDSTAVANGTASLTAAAYDAAGNSAVSSPVSINVSNAQGTAASDTTPPTVAITSPTNGSFVSGNVTVTTAVSDNSGASGITQSLYIDGVLKCTVTGAPLSCKWSAQKAAMGTHTIVVTARDKAGNSASAQSQVVR